MQIDLTTIADNWQALVGAVGMVGTYYYGKGKRVAQEGYLTKSLRELKSEVKTLKDETVPIVKREVGVIDDEVKRIIEALERTYATMEYCHLNFPNKETFSAQIQSVREHISGQIDGVRQLLDLMMTQRKNDA